MDPSEIQSTSRLPKPLNECTSPELNEIEKVIDPSDAEFPSNEVEVGTVEVEVKSDEPEVEELPRISSDDEKGSSSKSSEDYEDYKKRTSTDYEKERERLKDLHSGKKLVSTKKTIPTFRNDKNSSPSNEGERITDGSISPSSEAYEELKNILKEANAYFSSSDDAEEKISENDERDTENEEKSSENEERSWDNVDKLIFSRAEGRGHHSSKASTVPVISETNDKVIITLKAVRKKTVIRILDGDAKISCEIKSRQKRRYEMSDNGNWEPKRKFKKTCKDIIITPKVPKTKPSKKHSEDVSFCHPNDSDDSDSDKENRFNADSIAGNVLETSASTKEGTLFTDPSPSTKRAIDIAPGIGRKKIRLIEEDSLDEEMKNSSK